MGVMESWNCSLSEEAPCWPSHSEPYSPACNNVSLCCQAQPVTMFLYIVPVCSHSRKQQYISQDESKGGSLCWDPWKRKVHQDGSSDTNAIGWRQGGRRQGCSKSQHASSLPPSEKRSGWKDHDNFLTTHPFPEAFFVITGFHALSLYPPPPAQLMVLKGKEMTCPHSQALTLLWVICNEAILRL